MDPLDQLARAGCVRHDRTGLDGVVAQVESQFGLPFVGVLAVAIEAVLREDRTDVAVEVKHGRRGLRLGGQVRGNNSREEQSD